MIFSFGALVAKNMWIWMLHSLASVCVERNASLNVDLMSLHNKVEFSEGRTACIFWARICPCSIIWFPQRITHARKKRKECEEETRTGGRLSCCQAAPPQCSQLMRPLVLSVSCTLDLSLRCSCWISCQMNTRNATDCLVMACCQETFTSELDVAASTEDTDVLHIALGTNKDAYARLTE